MEPSQCAIGHRFRVRVRACSRAGRGVSFRSGRVPGALALAIAVVPFIIPSTLPSAVHAATLRVPGDQPTIQAGLDAAAPGDTVLVAPGTWSGPGNRELDFMGKDLCLLSEAGAMATILDGEEEFSGFNFHSTETRAAVIDGFTLTRFGTTWTTGAVFIHASSPTIRRCRFVENHPRFIGGGAAIHATDGSPRVEDCVFLGNWSGGFEAAEQGGAVATSGGVPEFERCEFRENEGNPGGAIFVNGDAVFTDCVFDRNRATSWIREGPGGAMFCEFGRTTLTRCRFAGNVADLDGGAVALGAYAELIVRDSEFTGNSAGLTGGAIAGPEGIQALDMERSLVTANTAGTGSGGIAVLIIEAGTARIAACTVSGNAGPSGSSGGAISIASVTPAGIENTIVTFSRNEPAIRCPITAPVLRCTDLFGNEGGDWTECIAGQAGTHGNLSLDPLYCDEPGGDFRIASTSPCAPAHAPDCGLIGARDVGCGFTPTQETTWGRLKRGF